MTGDDRRSAFRTARFRALLGDLNEDLVICFREVRADPDAVMACLAHMPNTRENFERIRALDPSGLNPVERAARVVYLNKTAFRGLWRVNQRGGFNVPYGAYDRPLFNRNTMQAASRALQKAEIEHGSFEALLERVRPGDLVYLDPPYVPAGGYSDFKRYTPGQFREDDHERLVEHCHDLDRRGIPFILTNTDNDAVRALYRAFDLYVIPTRRDVNLDKLKRSSTDLVVANYDISGALPALGQIPNNHPA